MISAIMKSAILYICLIILLAAYATKQKLNQEKITKEASNILSGSWLVQVENLQNEVITEMTIRFTQEKANSCMAVNFTTPEFEALAVKGLS